MSLSKENLVHLESFLKSLEDPTLNTQQNKLVSYQQIKDILNSDSEIQPELLNKLIAACTTELKPAVGYLPNILNAVMAILKKREHLASLNLLPSAQAIVNILNSLSTPNKSGPLNIVLVKTMCLETLLAYPDHTLDSLVKIDCSGILKAIEFYCSMDNAAESRSVTIKLVIRLLKSLSPESKSTLVTSGVDIWFRHLVPTLVMSLTADVSLSNDCIQALELLTDSLRRVDYSENKHWMEILKCICDSERYPAVIKQLFKKHNDISHRLWIVLIRLLKDQISNKMFANYANPINALLPCLEHAFKDNVTIRILAFKCWDVLVECFSSDTNESSNIRKLKLLLIPMRTPNAKVLLTAKAKFDTFWNLIRNFQSKMGPMTGEVLMCFIKCCYGSAEIPITCVPGLTNECLKADCVQALVELFGHVNCDGCVTIPPLRGRLIKNVILVQHWKEWLYALNIAIKFTTEQESELSRKHLSCMWKSLLLSLAELTDNDTRSEMFDDVLGVVERLLQHECISEQQTDRVYSVMITPLFDRDEPVVMLLHTSEDKTNGPIHKILKLLLDPVMEQVIARKTNKDLKLVTDVLLDSNICNPNELVEWLVLNLPYGENSAVLWSALAESICQSDVVLKDRVSRAVVMWPLQSTSSLMTERSLQVYDSWKTLFNWCAKLTQYDCDEMLQLVQDDIENSLSVTAVNFKMCVTLTLIKKFALKKNYPALLRGIEPLNSLLVSSKISSYNDIANAFPMLLDTLELILTTLKDTVQVAIAEKVLKILHILINLTMDHDQPSNDINRTLIKPLNDLFQAEAYLHLKHVIVDDLIKYLATEIQIILNTNVIDILKTFLTKRKDNEKEFREKVESALFHANNKIPLTNLRKDDPILKKIDVNSQKDNDETLDKIQKSSILIKNIAAPKVTLTTFKTIDKNDVNVILHANQTTKHMENTPTKVLKIIGPATNNTLLSSKKFVKAIDKNDIVKLNANENPKQPETTPAKVFKIVVPATSKTLSTSKSPVNTIDKATIAKLNAGVGKVPSAKKIDTPVSKTNDAACNIISVEVLVNPDANKAKLPAVKISPKDLIQSHKENDTPKMLTKSHVDNLETNTKISNEINNLYSEIPLETTHINVVAPIAISTEAVTKTPADADEITPEAALAKLFENKPKTNHDSPTPSYIEAKKNSKKKEPSIVKTVVENGEEYAVVKSHWKFNPRKLTEHQKEKLKEKRQDIPALYQDYSQSQDEVNLATWNTDSQSQDTLSTSKSNSNSTSTISFSAILLNPHCSNNVPKNMENVLSQGQISKESSKKLDESPAVQNTKTPHTPLKNKVYRSKRHLMVKSGLPDKKNPSDDKNPSESVALETPVKKNIVPANITKSAPSKIRSDRPSRSIKKPKKFEDSEVTSIIKRRRNNSQSQLACESATPFIVDASIESIPTLPIRLETKDTQENFPVTEAPITGVVIRITNEKNSDMITVQNNDVVNVIPIAKTDKSKLKRDSNSFQMTPKSSKKQSRLEKQLSIDMVERHPLSQSQPLTPTRPTQRILSKSTKQSDRERSAESSIILNEAPEQPALKKRRGRPPKARLEGPPNSRESTPRNAADDTTSVTVLDSQSTQEKSPMSNAPPRENNPTSSVLSIPSRETSSTSTVSSLEKSTTSASQELESSEDIIESSQDSSITTISVKSSNQKSPKPVLLVTLGHNNAPIKNKSDTEEQTECDIYKFINDNPIESIEKSNEDIELPKNKSVAQDMDENDLTTEPFSVRQSVTNDCIVISDELSSPILIIGTETQEIADADTEPFELHTIANSTPPKLHPSSEGPRSDCFIADKNSITEITQQNNTNTQYDLMQTFIDETLKAVTDFSPTKDKAQKNKEFLNDTLEISPIKTLSPIRDQNTPSPETTLDYVVIKLNSPVQFNGEPFNEKCDSPEVFTEDKTSPEKRHQSPPKEEVKVTCGSPSSLSLKKNKVIVGIGSGRAAQIIGLCAPKKTGTVDATKEGEQSNKFSTPTLKTDRNFRILQNSINDSQNEPMSEEESEENFLELKRFVPAAECSPSVPILKRKLADIADETTISPASKRKRVSFHDPPVSTTMVIEKYIEPCGRSPQNSAMKRQERMARGFIPIKSKKRLDNNNMFKLDSELTKTIEKFNNDPPPMASYSEQSSIEQTPAAEVVTTSELNNTDPICPDLLDCKDPISNIAGDLSSPAMKDLLIKELAGKVGTVADLAKMTELEVNRLCIKAPKVKVAQQVLSAYAALRNVTINDTRFDTLSNISKTFVDLEQQTTSVVSTDSEMQTDKLSGKSASSQTEARVLTDSAAQTNESGIESTDSIVTKCLSERPRDFMESLGRDRSMQIAEHLPFDACLDLLMRKVNETNREAVVKRLFKDKGIVSSHNTIMQYTDLLSQRFQRNDLISLCSKIMEKINESSCNCK